MNFETSLNLKSIKKTNFLYKHLFFLSFFVILTIDFDHNQNHFPVFTFKVFIQAMYRSLVN